MKKLLLAGALSGMVLSAPAFAQGQKASSPVELAEKAKALEPGQWVWAPDIAPEGPVVVLVDLSRQLSFVYRNGVAIGVATISSGKKGYETPTGVFQILQKDADHRSSTYNNAPMPYQERLTWDGIALHAGGLPGYPESHGCVHLPYEFAKLLFSVTKMGGTVVVEGKAGVPELASSAGVLSPVSGSGDSTGAKPLPAGTSWTWDDDAAQASGPLSVVISTSDEQLVAMRGGKEVGRAKAVIEGKPVGTHVFTLQGDESGKRQWLLIGVPGNEDEANRPLDPATLKRLRLPKEFLAKIKPEVGLGTTVLVTPVSVGAKDSGKQITVLDAGAEEDQPVSPH